MSTTTETQTVTCRNCGADLTESAERLARRYPDDPPPRPFCDDDCAVAYELEY